MYALVLNHLPRLKVSYNPPPPPPPHTHHCSVKLSYAKQTFRGLLPYMNVKYI